MEGIALHDFNSESLEELSFKVDDVLILYDYAEHTDWYHAELNGKQGLVPSNFIKPNLPFWFKSDIKRADAERRLGAPHLEDGAFIVRPSESCPKDYSLSVRCNGQVQHFRILRDQQTSGFHLWSKCFKTIRELVENYKKESVSRTQKIYLREMKRYVQAKYDFPSNIEKLEDNELPFRKGDVILLINSEDDHWWAGRFNNREGYFPKDYVTAYTDPVYSTD